MMRELGVFCLWTVTSFICHYSAKQILRQCKDLWGDEYSLIYAVIIALIQVLTCFSAVKTSSLYESSKRQSLAIITFHYVATAMTVYSMAMISADSTFAIKLTEPISTAVIFSVVSTTRVTSTIWFSLILTVIGACGFAGIFQPNLAITAGVIYAFLSNISYGIRNTVIKSVSTPNAITFHEYRRVGFVAAIFASCLTICVMFKSVFKFDIIAMSIYLTAAAWFHVIYSYVSTGVVLKYLSVVAHAVANIMKRLFVILLLYLTGQRVASLSNTLSLLICVAGLVLYRYADLKMTWNKMTAPGSHSYTQTGWLLKRQTFARLLLFGLIILTCSTLIGSGTFAPMKLQKMTSQLWSNVFKEDSFTSLKFNWSDISWSHLHEPPYHKTANNDPNVQVNESLWSTAGR